MMVCWAFLCCAVLSLPTLLSAQSCNRLTAEDLASTEAESTDGLIAAALMSTEMLDSLPQIQLLNYNLVCEATSSIVGRYRFVSVVAEYTRNGSMTASQFEFGCSNVTWGIVVSGRSTEIVTTPPDGALNSTLRSDCAQCLSPLRAGSNSNMEHHCQACREDCTGLMMCTSVFTCCNYADTQGRCTLACPTNSTIVSNSSCECFPGLTGVDCETEIDECDPNPCENDGNCTDMFNGFFCECAAGYLGDTCDECSDTLCQNGGTCFLSSEGTETLCRCPENFQGATCQEPIGSSSCDQSCFIAILVVAVVLVLIAAILTISIGAFITSKQRGKQTISKRRKKGKKKGKVVSSPGVSRDPSGFSSPAQPQSSYIVKEPTSIQFQDPEQPSEFVHVNSTLGTSIPLTFTSAAAEIEEPVASSGAQHAIGLEEEQVVAGSEYQQESAQDYQKLDPKPHDYQRPETMISSTTLPGVSESSKTEVDKFAMESSNL